MFGTVITQTVDRWAQETFEQRARRVIPPKDIANFLNICKLAGIRPAESLTGSFTQGLIKDKTSQNDLPFVIENFIFEQYFNGQLCPIGLIRDVIKGMQGAKHGTPQGAVARSLVTLPSTLRKLDLQERLQSLLYKEPSWRTQFGNAQMRVAPTFNTEDKHDFTVSLSFECHLWTYFSSSRSWEYCYRRLAGDRSALRKGLHTLCPLTPSTALHYRGWYLFSNKVLLEVATCMANQTPTSYLELLDKASVNPNILSQPQVFLV